MIWLIGNRGMLGSDVEKLLVEKNIDFIATDREIDITDYEMLYNFVGDKSIEWVINCSAYTAVDRAEDESELAYRINADGVLNIAQVCKSRGATLIHISTDYVFDGTKESAYTEEDPPNPLGVYGKSKYEGEKYIQRTIPQYFIIRTSWLYGKNGNNFVYTMLRLFKERDSVKVVSDQYGSPTYTIDLANLIFKIVNIKSNDFGIYHFTNEGRTTWYQFAKRIYDLSINFNLLNKNVKIIPVTTKEYPVNAKRPKYSYLSKEKIKNKLGINIRNWENALSEFIELLSIK